MGVTTLYHPVSLQTIRGAAAHGGFNFGVIRQLRSNMEAGTALYRAMLVAIPQEMAFMSVPAIWECLQQCFMDDIHIIRMGEREFGGIDCWIATKLPEGGAE